MEDNRQIAEFNESLLQIQRIHNHWLNLDKFKQRGDLAKAKFVLDSIEDELYYDAKDMDDKENEKYIEQLDNIEKEHNKIIINKEADAFIKLYNLVRKKERLLREIQQECGKGARYKSADEDTLD